MPSKNSFGVRAKRFFASRLFFRLTLLIFGLQAVWIALSARYPQAFDEQFHFGIIQIYSHHLSPFLAHQPPGADQYGALTRDPSYFYHYLMSFPYRLLAHLTTSQTAQVIGLRLINIAFLASSLLIFKKVLRLIPVSEATANVVLAFVVLLPVFPLLGAQINYDNLLVPLSGLAILSSLQFLAELRERHVWQWDRFARLAAICFIASVVKYPFLPIFAGIGLAIVWTWWTARKAGIRYECTKTVHQRLRLALYGLALLVSLSLFVQRDGINLVQYKTPTPDCGQVLTVQQCRAYLPWGRNYSIAQQHLDLAPWQVLVYPFDWLYHMMGELIFTISSNYNDLGTVDYHPGRQTIVLEVLTWTVFGLGAVAMLWRGRWLWRQPVLRVFILISTLYLGALGEQNLQDYLALGRPLAIHGRYLFPIMPLLLVMMWLAFRETLATLPIKRAWIKRQVPVVTAVVMVVMLVEGGGFVTYILRSQPSWSWPQSQPAQTANTQVQKLLKPLVLDINLQD